MTTDTATPVLRVIVLKRAAVLAKEHDLRNPDDNTKPLVITASNWRAVFREFAEPVPPIITGFDAEGDPIIDGTHRERPQRRVRVQAMARIQEAPDGTTTIICAGPCGEVRPTTKFPTRRSGGRGSVCRDCDALRLAERKAGLA